MSALTEKLNKWFAAIAFAEEGEHNTAMALVGMEPRAATKTVSAMDTWNATFAAAAFAEANCPEMALELLQGKKNKTSFAASIGLTGVRVWSGVVSMEEESFLHAVGLSGARLRLLTIRI
jgi:hypothetical protein